MELNEYQTRALQTALPNTDGVYCMVQCAAEAGEALGHYAKFLREDYDEFPQDLIVKEMGDQLWHIAVLAERLGITLEDVANVNLQKLKKRYEKGTLQGNGDDR